MEGFDVDGMATECLCICEFEWLSIFFEELFIMPLVLRVAADEVFWRLPVYACLHGLFLFRLPMASSWDAKNLELVSPLCSS